VELAEARGVPLILINIVCDLSKNSERLCRRKGENGKTRLADVEILERIRRETRLVDRERALSCGKNVF
jgi:hypothetical protein